MELPETNAYEPAANSTSVDHFRELNSDIDGAPADRDGSSSDPTLLAEAGAASWNDETKNRKISSQSMEFFDTLADGHVADPTGHHYVGELNSDIGSTGGSPRGPMAKAGGEAGRNDENRNRKVSAQDMELPETKADGLGADSTGYVDDVRKRQSDIDGITLAARGGSSGDSIEKAGTAGRDDDNTHRKVSSQGMESLETKGDGLIADPASVDDVRVLTSDIGGTSGFSSDPKADAGPVDRDDENSNRKLSQQGMDLPEKKVCEPASDSTSIDDVRELKWDVDGNPGNGSESSGDPIEEAGAAGRDDENTHRKISSQNMDSLETKGDGPVADPASIHDVRVLTSDIDGTSGFSGDPIADAGPADCDDENSNRKLSQQGMDLPGEKVCEPASDSTSVVDVRELHSTIEGTLVGRGGSSGDPIAEAGAEQGRNDENKNLKVSSQRMELPETKGNGSAVDPTSVDGVGKINWEVDGIPADRGESPGDPIVGEGKVGPDDKNMNRKVPPKTKIGGTSANPSGVDDVGKFNSEIDGFPADHDGSSGDPIAEPEPADWSDDSPSRKVSSQGMESLEMKADGTGADSSSVFNNARKLKSDIDGTTHGTTPADCGGSSGDPLVEAGEVERYDENTNREVSSAQEAVGRGENGVNDTSKTPEDISRPSPTKNDDRSVKVSPKRDSNKEEDVTETNEEELPVHKRHSPRTSRSNSVGGVNPEEAPASATSSVSDKPFLKTGDHAESTPQTRRLASLLPFVPRLALGAYDTRVIRLPTSPMHLLHYAAVGLFEIYGFSTIADRLEDEEADVANTSEAESERETSHTPGSSTSGQTSVVDATSEGRIDDFESGSVEDRLNKYLNYVSGLLTDTVEMHGGDIIMVFGDAFVVCWPSSKKLGMGPLKDAAKDTRGKNLEISCLRAALCARDAVQACAEKFFDSDDPVLSSLRLRVGLGANRLLVGHVGGVRDKWEVFVTGKACEEMSGAQGLANDMQIIFSYNVCRWIREFKGLNGGVAELKTVKLSPKYERLVYLSCESLDLPATTIPPPPRELVIADVLQMYVPATALIRLEEFGRIKTGGDLRKVTVVSVDLVDVRVVVPEFQDENLLEEVDETVRSIQDLASHFKATLHQLIVDSKGTIATIVFGLPPIYLEESNAASGIDFGFSLFRQGIQGKVGVTTGTAFAGIIGNSFRQEFAVMGDVMNTSRRLMDRAARNTVLCDASTAEEAEHAFWFKEFTEIEDEREEEPIAVFQPLARGDARRIKSVKTTHTEDLEDVLDRAHVPSGTKTVMIEGEPGSGKTILLSKAVRMMENQKIQAYCSAGAMNERHASLFPFKQILCQLLGKSPNVISCHDPGHRAARVSSCGVPSLTAGTKTMVAAAGDVAMAAHSNRKRSNLTALLWAGEHETNPDTIWADGVKAVTHPIQPPIDAADSDSKRETWSGKLVGDHCIGGTPGTSSSFEPTAVKENLVKNSAFASLMEHPELSKDLPLLNMILPLYNEQAAGAATVDAQDTHKKLRRLAGMVAALVVHRLRVSSEDTSGVRRLKDAAVTATPRRTSVTSLRATVTSEEADQEAWKMEGCKAALVFDNAQWLDHNSWELTLLLREILPGMLILTAFRPFTGVHMRGSVLLTSVPGSLKMNMGRLTTTQVMLLLSRSFGVQEKNKKLLDFLEGTAKGNPRAVIHMMEDLLKKRIVKVDHSIGAVVVLKQLSEDSLKIKEHAPLPIIETYDQLSRSTQQLAEVAAVIGQEAPVDLLVDMYSLLAFDVSERLGIKPSSDLPSDGETQDVRAHGSPVDSKCLRDASAGAGDVVLQVGTLVRMGFLERCSSKSVRFVAKQAMTVIYGMIPQSKREDMHKQVLYWFVTRRSLVDLRPHFRFLGKHAMAARDRDLGLTLFVMAAEVAISHGDPTEARLACNAVTEAVDSSCTVDHLTFLDQVLRETKLQLLVGQTAILLQDWESAEMSLQLAVDISGVDARPTPKVAEGLFASWWRKRKHRLSSPSQPSAPATNRGYSLEDNVEQYGACGVVLHQYGNDAKRLLRRLDKYQAMTRSFLCDLMGGNTSVVDEHRKIFVASAGTLSSSLRTNPARLPHYLRGNALATTQDKKKREGLRGIFGKRRARSAKVGAQIKRRSLIYQPHLQPLGPGTRPTTVSERVVPVSSSSGSQ